MRRDSGELKPASAPSKPVAVRSRYTCYEHIIHFVIVNFSIIRIFLVAMLALSYTAVYSDQNLFGSPSILDQTFRSTMAPPSA